MLKRLPNLINIPRFGFATSRHLLNKIPLVNLSSVAVDPMPAKSDSFSQIMLMLGEIRGQLTVLPQIQEDIRGLDNKIDSNRMELKGDIESVRQNVESVRNDFRYLVAAAIGVGGLWFASKQLKQNKAVHTTEVNSQNEKPSKTVKTPT